MNNYSLASDSRRWWWLSAAAGTLGTAAATAVLVVPATGTVIPVDVPPATIGGAADSGSSTVVERPCYLARPGWNTVRGWEQPVCTTLVGGRDDQASDTLRRPPLDYLP